MAKTQSVVTRAIRDQKPPSRALTAPEARAVLRAISQMTLGKAYDYHEWEKSTRGLRSEWLALLLAEKKLERIANK